MTLRIGDPERELMTLVSALERLGIRVMGFEGARDSILAPGMPPVLSGGRQTGGIETPAARPEAPARPQSTSILVDKMMSLGLIRRETDPTDRRRACLYATAEAEPLVKHLELARDDINRLVRDALGAEGSAALLGLLDEFLDVVEGSEAAGDRT